MKTWKEKVQELMAARGMNQKQLSEASGITRASISRYLNGDRTPRIDVIMNFAKALNVTPQYLLEDEEESHSAFKEISSLIARQGNELTAEEKNKLIRMIVGQEE